jgi:hypothetical protein
MNQPSPESLEMLLLAYHDYFDENEAVTGFEPRQILDCVGDLLIEVYGLEVVSSAEDGLELEIVSEGELF